MGPARMARLVRVPDGYAIICIFSASPDVRIHPRRLGPRDELARTALLSVAQFRRHRMIDRRCWRNRHVLVNGSMARDKCRARRLTARQARCWSGVHSVWNCAIDQTACASLCCSCRRASGGTCPMDRVDASSLWASLLAHTRQMTPLQGAAIRVDRDSLVDAARASLRNLQENRSGLNALAYLDPHFTLALLDDVLDRAEQPRDALPASQVLGRLARDTLA